MVHFNLRPMPKGIAGVMLGLLACGGCGNSDRATVSGHMQRADGSPVVLARVIAHCTENAKTAYGTTDSEGYFEMAFGSEEEGLLPGTYAVYLIEDRGVVEGQMQRTISRKYSNPQTSGLSFEIGPGQDEVFDITADPPP